MRARGAVTLIKLYILVALGMGTVMEGFAPRYDPGGMERVARNRDLPIVSCMVSSPYYDVGEWVYVWGVNTKVLRYCRITDESADVDTTGRNRAESDRERHKRTKRIIEAGYNEAVSLCGKKRINDPPTRCPVIVFRLEDE